MDIYTVRDNLANTIKGKEAALAIYEARKDIRRSASSQMAMIAAIEFLTINIDELKKILADVEVCCNQSSAASWADNPDRSGGAFTNEELNRGAY